MLRTGTNHPLQWADKTMSALKDAKLEACEKYLAGLPCFSVFDQECTVVNAETFFDFSFYAEESNGSELHTPELLREAVLKQFPDELDLLSDSEHELIVKIILAGGQWCLRDWNDLEPAIGLVRRLWCSTSGQGENRIIRLSHQLCTAALLILANDSHRELRDKIDHVHEETDNLLYLNGMIKANAPFRRFCELLGDSAPKYRDRLVWRMLKVGFDYVYGKNGDMFLIHSGLAEPDLSSEPSDRFLSDEMISGALDSTDSLEDPLYNRLVSLLGGAVRPEWNPEDISDDMILLAKQNVSLVDMRNALSSSLICMPTREMTDVLSEMHQIVPRWLSMKMSRIQ